jgi:hypothetical protein
MDFSLIYLLPRVHIFSSYKRLLACTVLPFMTYFLLAINECG